jgi:hypothetical protein
MDAPEEERRPGDLRDHYAPGYEANRLDADVGRLEFERSLEVTESGFRLEKRLGIAGPAWLRSDVGVRWADEDQPSRIPSAVAAVEEEPSRIGVSALFLDVATKL